MKNALVIAYISDLCIQQVSGILFYLKIYWTYANKLFIQSNEILSFIFM